MMSVGSCRVEITDGNIYMMGGSDTKSTNIAVLQLLFLPSSAH